MKKELILAILIGLSVGLVIVFGVYRTRTIFTPRGQQERLEVSPVPSPSAEVLSNLVVHSPVDESIQEAPDVTIAGSTNANDFVVIMVNNESFITTADKSGNFSISAVLEAGGNIIQVNSINENGDVTTQELTVIYTTQPLFEEDAETSGSANTNEQKNNDE